MGEKVAMKIALFRYQIIAPALVKDLVGQKEYLPLRRRKSGRCRITGAGSSRRPRSSPGWLTTGRRGISRL